MRPLRRKCERARENISEKVCSMYGKKLDFLSGKVTVSDGIAWSSGRQHKEMIRIDDERKKGGRSSSILSFDMMGSKMM